MDHSWKQIGGFFALTFLILALVPILSAVTGASMDFAAVAASATEKTGIEQTSNLLTLFRLCLAEPGLWLLVLGSAVPSFAAIAIIVLTGPRKLKILLARFHPLGSGADLQMAIRAYGKIFVLYPIGLLLVYGLRSVLPGPDYALPENIYGPALLIALLNAAFMDQGALLEELGWRGYAQNEMQSRLLSPFTAALVIGVAWGLWHVPRDVFAGVIERLGTVQYLFLYLPSFVLGTVTTSIIAAYFINRCGGSVWPAIIVHGLGNDAVGLSGMASINQVLTPYHQITKALPFTIVAIAIVVMAGRELGRTQAYQPAE
jgi:membrane protease YdiL (CAAX protease family)